MPGARPMPALLASLRASPATESGVVKGANALDVPLWSDARNVLFRNGGPEKIGGWVGVVGVSGAGAVRGMDALQDEAAVQRLFFGDASRLWMWVPGTVSELADGLTGHVDETPTRDATVWSFARFGNWMICANGVDPVRVWRDGGTSEVLAGTTFTRAEIVRASRSFVLAFNTSNGAGYVEWCSGDDPEDWTPASGNSAGNLQVRDLNGPIKAVVPLGEQFLILGKNQAFLLSFVDAPLIWAYQPALQGIGAVGKAAAVEANRIAYGLGEMGFWATDGVTFRLIGTTAILEWLKTVWDGTQLSKVAATYDSSTETVIWSIPTASGGGEPTVSVAYTIPGGAWSVLGFGRSAWVPQLGVFKQPWGASGGTLHAHNVGHDAGGAALAAHAQTRPLDLGAPRAWKYLEAVEIQLRRLAGAVTLHIGWQANLDDPVTWDAGTPLGAGFAPVYTSAAGRFLSLRIGSTALGADWAMSGGDIWGDIGGNV